MEFANTLEGPEGYNSDSANAAVEYAADFADCASHQDVHLWYQGTIDPATNIVSDGSATFELPGYR